MMNASTQLISENQWIEFFNRFSRDHVGWRATIYVLDSEAGPQLLAENLPLMGIDFDTQGSRSHTIEISAGDTLGAHVDHLIDLPLHIHQAVEPDGSVDLQIAPAEGPMTLVHLRGPVQ